MPNREGRGARDASSLILGAMYADMVPPRAWFDRPRKGPFHGPVGRTTNPLRDIPRPAVSGHRECLFRRRSDGFTLIEVAAAVVVLALLVIPLLGARNRAVAAAARSSREFVVAQLAASKLSELASVPLEDIERAGEFEGAPGYSWNISVEAEDVSVQSDETEVTDEVEVEPHLYRVRLVVKYPGSSKGDDTPEVAVSTLVFKRETEEEEGE